MEKFSDEKQDTTNGFYAPSWGRPINLYERMIFNRIKRMPRHLREDALKKMMDRKSDTDKNLAGKDKSNKDQSKIQNEELPTPEQLALIRKHLKENNTTAEAVLESLKVKETNSTQVDSEIESVFFEQDAEVDTEEITQYVNNQSTNTLNNDSVQRQATQEVAGQTTIVQPTQVLTVESIINSNITNAEGQVIGMSGTQTITYTYANGNQVSETYNVNWQEDNIVEGNLLYEHPAQPESFSIVRRIPGQIYPIVTDHSETGIAIHGLGRSEGCIIASPTIRSDIDARLDNNESIQGTITSVQDSRPSNEQQLAPLPY